MAFWESTEASPRVLQKNDFLGQKRVDLKDIQRHLLVPSCHGKSKETVIGILAINVQARAPRDVQSGPLGSGRQANHVLEQYRAYSG